MSWAAELDDDDIVLRVIVGTADWAVENLGGRWVSCDKDSNTTEFPGIGYGHTDGHPRRFAPPAPADLSKADSDEEGFDPRSLWWENGEILELAEIARRRGVLTAQEARDGVPVKPERARP